MRKIGLPTLGNVATRFYRDQLEQLYKIAHGNKTVCPLTETAVDFDTMNACLPDRFAQLTPLLEKMFLDLEKDKVSLIVVPNITLHVAIDRLALNAIVREKIVHPIHLGMDKLQAGNIREITLVGTRHTMQTGLIANSFEQRGIRVLRPDSKTMEALDRIRLSVYEGGVSDRLAKKMKTALADYSDIVIACTELSMLNAHNQFIDLARLQIENAIERL